MQAILELQRQLKAVQTSKASSAHKLNERNVVDIIRKLLDDNKVKLIYTQDGKEYLTNEQLEKEIKELLIESGGRINILEIPSHLGVNIEIIERIMDTFVKRNRVALINGQLISEIYAESMMEEIYELISEKGQLLLQELTTKYNLPMDYIRDTVQSRMESSLPQGCQLQGNSLMTKTFAERQICKVRGILRGVTRPVALTAIAQQFRIEEQKLKNVTEQLLKDNQIKGKIQQGLYVPAAFTLMQENAVKSFYSQNRYIEFNMLGKLQIQKPREFIEQVIGKDKGHNLANFFISQDLIVQIEASVHEIVENGTYIDLSQIIPSPFRSQDIQDLLAIEFYKLIRSKVKLIHTRVEANALQQTKLHFKAHKENNLGMFQHYNLILVKNLPPYTIVGDQCRLLPNNQHLCSEKFINKCLDELKKSAEERAIQNLKKGIKPTTEEQKKPQPSTSQSTSKKGKGGKGGNKKKGRQDNDSDEELKESSAENQLAKTITEESIKSVLESTLPEFKDTPQRDDFLFDSLVEFLVEPANKQYVQVFMEVFARQSTKQNASLNKNLEAELEDAFQALQFQAKQMESLKKFLTQEDKEKDFEAISAPVKAHWCKTDAQSLLNKLTMVQAFYNNINLNTLQISKDPKTTHGIVVNANDRKTVAKQFQKHVTAIFDQLGRCLADKNFDEFMNFLAENIKNLGARMKQVDKKIEKKVKDQVIKALKDITSKENIESPLMDYRLIFSSILNIKLAECNTYLNMPNEEWSCKIMTNMLLNLSIDSNINEQIKDDLIQGMQIYSQHCQAKYEPEIDNILKDGKAHSVELLLRLS